LVVVVRVDVCVTGTQLGDGPPVSSAGGLPVGGTDVDGGFDGDGDTDDGGEGGVEGDGDADGDRDADGEVVGPPPCTTTVTGGEVEVVWSFE
jgi:hypothetical protein